jgi:indole-3-pyruvate monooxygenase
MAAAPVPVGGPEVIIMERASRASACLPLRDVPSAVLECDDCVSSLWRKRAYDLPNSVSALHPADAPDYLPSLEFAHYLDAYAARFGVRARA